MKTLTSCLLCIFFCMPSAFCQIPAVTWEKEFPIKQSHYFSDIQELPNGNFVVLGAIEQPGDSNFDIWLLEINSHADTLKTRIMKSPGLDIPMRIHLNGNEGYLLAYLTMAADGGYKSRLMAVGTGFEVQWTAEAELSSAGPRTDLAVDNAGHFWWLNTFSGPDGKAVISLGKMDTKGNAIPVGGFSNNLPGEGYSIRALPDGTMALSCMVLSDKEKPLVQVIRMDQEGKTAWKATIAAGNKNLTPQCLCCTPDNSLLLGGWAGMCYNPDAPADEQIWDYDYLLSKIDASGKVLWTQNYNREGSEKGTAVAVLPDGNIMAGGKCETSFTGKIGPWLLAVDPNGNKISDQVYKFKFNKDQVARIIPTSDQGILMVGPGYIDAQQQSSGWLRKLNPVL